MNLKAIVFVILAAPATTLIAQENAPAKSMVLYDPLFWKDRLKLDAHQCQKIREINSQYYQKLYDVARESNHQAVKAKAAETLMQRSEEIWETFHPKQRKRWKKIWQENTI